MIAGLDLLNNSQVRTLVMSLVHAAGGRIHVTPLSASMSAKSELVVTNIRATSGTLFEVNDMTAGAVEIIDGDCTVVR